MDRAGVVRVVVESLYDAADDDSATGGPDITRGIYPVVMTGHRGRHRARRRRRAGHASCRAILADRETRPGS